MRLEDIPKKQTQKFVVEYKINLELFETMEQLRDFILKNRNRLYMRKHADYYRNYMREYNRKKYAKEHPNMRPYVKSNFNQYFIEST